ncbi:threonyl-tRNA synthetase [Tieghemostelium lacteum]|uniref:Threonyl-tRNA synthetase n=1 Tax=Tieghemostelium lacteum TaxID=361077 RepID=A0A151Z5U9_TIELA|nr:threonyl-tRNA synthetase [Tieghemostelium lacteum]|eukprot:KYQ89325.1 threonyl-tRNA synthetase [Tieghemostelium lacteum]
MRFPNIIYHKILYYYIKLHLISFLTNYDKKRLELLSLSLISKEWNQKVITSVRIDLSDTKETPIKLMGLLIKRGFILDNIAITLQFNHVTMDDLIKYKIDCQSVTTLTCNDLKPNFNSVNSFLQLSPFTSVENLRLAISSGNLLNTINVPLSSKAEDITIQQYSKVKCLYIGFTRSKFSPTLFNNLIHLETLELNSFVVRGLMTLQIPAGLDIAIRSLNNLKTLIINHLPTGYSGLLTFLKNLNPSLHTFKSVFTHDIIDMYIEDQDIWPPSDLPNYQSAVDILTSILSNYNIVNVDLKLDEQISNYHYKSILELNPHLQSFKCEGLKITSTDFGTNIESESLSIQHSTLTSIHVQFETGRMYKKEDWNLPSLKNLYYKGVGANYFINLASLNLFLPENQLVNVDLSNISHFEFSDMLIQLVSSTKTMLLLRVHCCYLQNPKKLFQVLTLNRTLKSLSFESTELYTPSLVEFIQSNHQTIKDFTLKKCCDLTNIIEESFKSYQNLQVLSLDFYKNSESNIQQIQSIIQYSPNLKHLNYFCPNIKINSLNTYHLETIGLVNYKRQYIQNTVVIPITMPKIFKKKIPMAHPI